MIATNRERGPAETIRRYESSLVRNEAPMSRAAFDYAEALRQVGRFSDSLAIYSTLELGKPSDSQMGLILLYKGVAFKEMGDLSSAEATFRRCCEVDSSTVPLVYLASVLAIQQRFHDAIQVLRKALLREGDIDEVWLNIALAERALGRLQDARQSAQEALRICEDYKEALALIADLDAALAVR